MNPINEYLNKIREEMEFCSNSSFTGNIEFQINFKQGGIANMNMKCTQSVKLDQDKGGL